MDYYTKIYETLSGASKAYLKMFRDLKRKKEIDIRLKYLKKAIPRKKERDIIRKYPEYRWNKTKAKIHREQEKYRRFKEGGGSVDFNLGESKDLIDYISSDPNRKLSGGSRAMLRHYKTYKTSHKYYEGPHISRMLSVIPKTEKRIGERLKQAIEKIKNRK